jgi:hypothetical protein
LESQLVVTLAKPIFVALDVFIGFPLLAMSTKVWEEEEN